MRCVLSVSLSRQRQHGPRSVPNLRPALAGDLPQNEWPTGRGLFIKPHLPVSEGPRGSELTGYAQVDGRAGLVLAVPLVDGLHVVRPRVAGGRRQDHQLTLQRDGSVSEKGQRQGPEDRLPVRHLDS